PAATPEPGVPTTSTAALATVHSTANDESAGLSWWVLLAAGIALFGIGLIVPESKLSHFTVFMLACFVGWQVIWNVKPALHTPLMS
ncbi:proton-translocating transhydrogenase family protein, partial [Escherichia coli]|nr:proton-translocating transhydrogenase family protein [Escherichia coli]